MALTAAQQLQRQFKVTASMLPILMHGDEAALLRLYCEEIGETEREPPTYAMQLGSHVEPFMLDYLEASTGHAITRRGEVVDHPTIPEFCCTLDGYRSFDDAIIENKFLAPFQHREQFIPYYFPQALAQMRCTGASRMILYVGRGTNEPDEFDITPKPLDPVAVAYEAEMWARVEAFRLCLRTFTPPVPMPRVIPPELYRTIDLSQDPMPNWGHIMIPTLQIYEATRSAAEEHERSGKEARSLVPDDVAVVLTPEHRLSRNKKGTVAIRRRNAA
jgi:YqaJ-like recombinase protein